MIGLPLLICLKAIQLGAPSQVIFDFDPSPTFTQFYKQHFQTEDTQSFESQSIKSDSSLDVTPVFEYEIPLDEREEDGETTSQSGTSEMPAIDELN